jgi:ABC-2 type transport system ATP-binding protein
MNDDVIRIEDLAVRRGSFRLEVPSWSVPPGTVVGVVGANGAGKTTLLETLAGFRRPARGRVEVFGLNPMRHPVEVRSRLGWMEAEMPVWNMRLDRLLRRLSGYYPTWDDALARDLAQRFKLDLRSRPGKLSRGQGTRLRLITAMAFRPKLLVLDEPTSGLDLGGRDALMEVVLGSILDGEASVVISSHQLSDVARIADRLLVIDDGRVVQEGAADELIGDDRTLEEAVRAWGAAG